jgi:hypothetical protein
VAVDQPLLVVPPLEIPQGRDQLAVDGKHPDPEQVLFQSDEPDSVSPVNPGLTAH